MSDEFVTRVRQARNLLSNEGVPPEKAIEAMREIGVSKWEATQAVRGATVLLGGDEKKERGR
jgi:hypothetical protein